MTKADNNTENAIYWKNRALAAEDRVAELEKVLEEARQDILDMAPSRGFDKEYVGYIDAVLSAPK